MQIAFNLATIQKPVRFYVGSCPDYSYNGQVYTHENVGENIPFLTQVHLQKDVVLLGELEQAGIQYEYVIMVADVEATDDIFCQRFTCGNEAEFLRRCRESRRKTEVLFKATGVENKMRSSSFFEEFGRKRFMELQGRYQKVLEDRYSTDNSFNTRVNGDMGVRMEMYRAMYPEQFNKMKYAELNKFLIDRTLRTMAQYLALGRLIGEKTSECYPMIIVHPTRNKGVFNERNRFLLPEDGLQPQPTIPIFVMNKKVY